MYVIMKKRIENGVEAPTILLCFINCLKGNVLHVQAGFRAIGSTEQDPLCVR